MSTTAKKREEPAEDPFKGDGLELVFVDPKVDVFKGQAVIGPAPPEFYTKKIMEELVAQAMKKLKPTLEEKEGYEVLKYEIIIKQHKNT